MVEGSYCLRVLEALSSNWSRADEGRSDDLRRSIIAVLRWTV